MSINVYLSSLLVINIFNYCMLFFSIKLCLVHHFKMPAVMLTLKTSYLYNKSCGVFNINCLLKAVNIVIFEPFTNSYFNRVYKE